MTKRIALIAAIVMAMLTAVGGVSAQAAPTHDFDIAGGPLDEVLSRFGHEAGILLSFAGGVTTGQRSQGLHGRYPIERGLADLLKGTNLQAVQLPNGSYVVQPLPVPASPPLPANVTESTALPPIRVDADADAATENSGAYATRFATIGSKIPVSLQETPASISVLTRAQMDDQNLTTIQAAMRYVTGVSSIDYGDGTAYFRARGSQLGIEFDGVSIVSGLQYQQQFDLAMYDRIELLRGPSSIMDGSGEPGGTVSLMRKRPQDTFHVSTETRAGTFGSFRQMVDVTGPLNEHKTVRGRAVIVGTDALQSIRGTREKDLMIYGALDVDLSPRTTLSLSATYQVTPISGVDYGVGGVVNDSRTALVGRLPSSYEQNFSPGWNSAYTSIQEVNASVTHRLSNDWQASATLYYRHGLLKSYYAYSGAGVLANDLASYVDQRQRVSVDWFGADTHASGPINVLGRAHKLTIGANLSTTSSSALSGSQPVRGPGSGGLFNVFDPNAVPAVAVPYTSGTNDRLEQYGVYAQARIRLASPLTLVLGAREVFLQERTQSVIPTVVDWRTVSQVNHRFLPSAGVVWDLAQWATAYASYSRFLTAQTDVTYTGSLLPPRSGEQYETGLKTSLFDGRLSTTAAVFRINDNQRAIADPDHPTGSIAGGRARDQGIEFEVSGQPTSNWNVYAGYTYLSTSFVNDSPNLTDGTDPKHLFKLWTNYRITDGMFDGVSIGGGMLAQSAVSRGVMQGGYAIYNAKIAYQVNRHIAVSLQVNNLFNRSYYLRPPGGFFSVFGDRRNAMLTVRSDY